MADDVRDQDFNFEKDGEYNLVWLKILRCQVKQMK